MGGTTGFGYTIIDPRTGAGAYRISSGASGGKLEFDDKDASLLIISAFFKVLFALGDMIKGVRITAGVLSVLFFLETFVNVSEACSEDPLRPYYLLQFTLLFAFISLATIGFGLAGILLVSIYGNLAASILEAVVVSNCMVVRRYIEQGQRLVA